jgi:hypothetical protein
VFSPRSSPQLAAGSRGVRLPGRGPSTIRAGVGVPCHADPPDAIVCGTTLPKQVENMTGAVEIKMTYRGFDVTTRGCTRSFVDLTDAFAFAQQRMAEAKELREISRRCE